MKFSLDREQLLKPLSQVIGVVERRQTLPILSNVLLNVKDKQLKIVASDLEVELQSEIELSDKALRDGEITVPGRKLMDICRALPEATKIEITLEKAKLNLHANAGRFQLSTLPAADFPLSEDHESPIEFSLPQSDLRYLTQRAHFAMAQQDVRYYLNGMLFEVNEGVIRTVATDGHRLALNTVNAAIVNNTFLQVILPRKGVAELMRLLDDDGAEVQVSVSPNHMRLLSKGVKFISKLVDGRFPDYNRVLPKGGDKEILIDRDVLKQALMRTSILSNEKIRGVRLQLRQNLLRLSADNPEHEAAEEDLEIKYHGQDLDIGFNVNYLLDILNAVDPGEVKLTFSDANSSILIEEAAGEGNGLFVVMPMRL